MDAPELVSPGDSLAKRSLGSLGWTSLASMATLPISLIQMVALARFLPVEAFGLYSGLVALVNLTYPPFEFGLSAAFLHRAPETRDEEHSLAVFFTLRLILTTIWAILLIALALTVLSGLRRQVMFMLVISAWMLRLSLTGQVLLIRRVRHQRLAVLDILQTAAVFVVAVMLAKFTGSVWALTVAPALQAVLNWILLVGIRPVWKPRLVWDRPAARYYMNFGGRTVGGLSVAVALDYLDDLWTNLYLGDFALGFYSRAYRFASYPRMILAEPVNSVSAGIYSELKGDRLRLSQAFFRVNALLLRTGFLLAGWLALIAPLLIVLLLGEKWLPMLPAFRLMLLYTLLDPIKLTVANVLIACGHPEQATLARLGQLLALVGGLFLFGPRWGISGVALAVNGMLVVGLVLLMIYARRHVDFSPRRMFAAPAIALMAGLFTGTLAGNPEILGEGWIKLFIQSLAFSTTYSGVLFALERRELIEVVRWAYSLVSGVRTGRSTLG